MASSKGILAFLMLVSLLCAAYAEEAIPCDVTTRLIKVVCKKDPTICCYMIVSTSYGSTRADRQALCSCFQGFGTHFASWANNHCKSPSLPYEISPSTNCSSVA